MMPRRRSILWLKNATAKLATAMPSVVALTANPIAAGVTPEGRVSSGRMAWVANRSTRVRKAMCPIRRLRAMTPNDDCGMAPSWELGRAINALFACANWGLPLTSGRIPARSDDS